LGAYWRGSIGMLTYLSIYLLEHIYVMIIVLVLLFIFVVKFNVSLGDVGLEDFIWARTDNGPLIFALLRLRIW
jgi:hypothetical protein